MKLVNCIIIVQVIYLCQASEHSSTQTGQNVNTTKPSEEFNSVPYILQHAGKCTWTFKMPGNSSRALLALTAESRDKLVQQICQDLGCGGIYGLTETNSPPKTSCFQNCSYRDRRLLNCSENIGSNCVVTTEVVCGHQAVRLAEGADRCAGRVELWEKGKWGTVCDDQWDLRDADVVCSQLGCGFAISVSGQGGSFPRGSGPIHLDELNCTGSEGNLWDCPATQQEHDCGHKEDAGVVCSEMKAVRLTGGVDRCSGRVEIHRNGSWGTVCDTCWDKQAASMVCSMLKCGDEWQEYTRFNPPIVHNNGTLWYYMCSDHDDNLWQCREFINNTNLCMDTNAAALICKGSLGFPIATTPDTNLTTDWTASLPADTTTVGPSRGFFFLDLSPELLACIALSVVLFVVLTANAVLCCHHRRRDALLVQQRHTNLQKASEYQCSEYQDTVDLIKITAGPVARDEAPSNPRYLWTQLSSADSTSLDTDYEQYDPSNESSVALSTFRNSQRYRTDMNPLMGAPALGSLSEEAPRYEATGLLTNHNGPTRDDYAIVSKSPSRNLSVDSFESSSTSSGECYENTRHDDDDSVTAGITEPPQPPVCYSSTDTSRPIFNTDQLQFHSGQMINRQESDLTSDDEEDGPVYSPVSPDCIPSSSEDYDDIA
ncbi:T-cell differentiation antigen CD6-like isoform X3 [Centroberyx affinis]|uniref:T-cell differentiation antigen CD6-like isoform X3 n=1 Tax=Centroberyx affinis TaxID=166261 RepID=UPI003A5BB6E7